MNGRRSAKRANLGRRFSRLGTLKEQPLQLLELHSHRTHALAYENRCLTFDGSQSFPAIAAAIHAQFGFLPSDLNDLVTNWSATRMDILMGAFYPGPTILSTRGNDVAIDPTSSPTALSAARLLGLTGIRRSMMADGWNDIWITGVDEMVGGAPETLFHGTSDTRLDAILKLGLRTDASANWDVGGRNHVYLTATPQTAGFHATRTAKRTNGKPIVLCCSRPKTLLPDWDVVRRLVNNPDVPSTDGTALADEAGLYASPDPIPPADIFKITTPETGKSAASWGVIWP